MIRGVAAETQSLRLLRLEHAASRMLTDVDRGRDAFSELAPLVGGLLGWSYAAFWLPNRSGDLRCGLLWHAPGQEAAEFDDATRALRLAPGAGLPGRVWSTREAAWVAD